MGQPVHAQPDFFSLQIAEAKRFYLELQPSAKAPLAVVSGGCEHCAPDYEIHRDRFPYWSVEFVAQGKGALRLGPYACDLAAGALFAYGPGIAQDIVSDARQPLVKYFVDFSGRRAKPLLEQYAPAPGAIVQTAAPSEVLGLWDALIREGLKETPYARRSCALLLELLLVKIAETAVPPGAAASPAFATYRRCKQHIEDRWLQLRSLEQLAAECHVDASHLCRLFQRFDHQSPYQYLLRLKMNYAAKRLQELAPVKQITEEVGFGDPFHFSRVFKSVMGVPPSQFARFGNR